MDEEERRALLRSLNDNQYTDVMNVSAAMPNIKMIIKSEGIYMSLVMPQNFEKNKGVQAFNKSV